MCDHQRYLQKRTTYWRVHTYYDERLVDLVIYIPIKLNADRKLLVLKYNDKLFFRGRHVLGAGILY